MGITLRPPTSDELAVKMMADMDRLRAEVERLRADRETLLGCVNGVWQTADRHLEAADLLLARNALVRIKNTTDRAIAEVQSR